MFWSVQTYVYSRSRVLYPPPFLKKRTRRNMIYHGKSWSQPETHGTWSRWPQVGAQVLLTSSYCPKRHRIPHHPYQPSAVCAATQGISKGPKSLSDQPSTQFWGPRARHPPSHSLTPSISTRQGINTMKSFCIEIRPGRSLTNDLHGKIRLSFEKTKLLHI